MAIDYSRQSVRIFVIKIEHANRFETGGTALTQSTSRVKPDRFQGTESKILLRDRDFPDLYNGRTKASVALCHFPSS